MANIDVNVDTGAIHGLITGEGAKVVVAAALECINTAKKLCPVDTGRLRGSISYELGTVNGLPSARIGSNVEYAIFVELGTSKMAAQPFLRPALASVKGVTLA